MWKIPLAILLLAGCSDSSGPAVETYQVTAGESDTQVFQDGSVVYTADVRVTDAGNTRIDGAVITFEASLGTVQGSGTSGTGGLGSVTWTITPSQRGNATSATLSACAQNQTPTDCTPELLTELHF